MPEEHTHLRLRADGDVEELRQVFDAIADFMGRIKGFVKEFMEMVLSSVDGAKLGEDVGSFYKRLVESGLPPEEAMRLTEEYFRRRLEAVPSPSKLIEVLSSLARKPRVVVPTLAPRGGEAAARSGLENVAEQLEEIREMLQELPVPEEEKKRLLEQLESLRGRISGKQREEQEKQ